MSSTIGNLLARAFKRPQRAHFMESLPRNASLKVRKDVVRAQLTEATRSGTCP